MDTRERLIHAYDVAAQGYLAAFRDELESKPFDRELLGRFAAAVPEGSLVCDLGCGPGHVTEYLSRLGLRAFGMDIAPGMVQVARKTYPLVRFEVGDMLNLSLPDGSLGGIIGLYSIIHVGPHDLPRVCREMSRVLVEGGSAVLSFHRGSGELRAENWLDKGVSFHCHLYEAKELTAPLEAAGLSIEQVQVRRPYPTEHPSERVYIWAGKPR